MQQPKPIKICLVGQSLAFGGAEKAMGELSIYFDSIGFDVHNVIVLDAIAYPFAGALLNLGKLKTGSNNVFDKARRFRTLRNYLRDNSFDFIIDFRVRVSFVQEFFIRTVLYNAPVYYTVHSAIPELYFPKKTWQARAVYAKADGIVAVSNGVKATVERIFELRNVATIPNAVDFRQIGERAHEPIAVNDKFIVAAGRMDDDVKQFAKLIAVYSKSGLPASGIRLVILGDGKLRAEIEAAADENVVFTGFVENPYAWFSKAEFFVLSSKKEGLPMVILESLACGTPVIAFDCESGPSEMIDHEQNGLLVADQNWDALLEAMNRLAADSSLLAYFRENAASGIQRFSVQNVGRQWLDYLKIP